MQPGYNHWLYELSELQNYPEIDEPKVNAEWEIASHDPVKK